MIHKNRHGFVHHLYNNMKFYWLLLTLPLLLLSLLFSWKYFVNKNQQHLKTKAQLISQHTDDFIEDLMQEVYTLPVFKTRHPECDKLIPLLDRISNNSPKISGMMVADTHHTFQCSNLPYYSNIHHRIDHGRSITGPLPLPGFSQPVFEISQKIGDYHVGIIVLASLFENDLSSYKTLTDSVSLYNQPEQRTLVMLSAKEQSSARHTNKEDVDASKATEGLQSINGVDVMVLQSHNKVLYQLWFNQLLMLCFLLIITYSMFILIRRSFATHYSLHSAMKQAIKHKRFYPVYQPIYDQTKQKYNGAEVLLRWHDFKDEIMMPDYFIAEAETTGLIVPITLQIIEMAFKDTKGICETDSGFHLSFNLSALHFINQDFFDRFFALVREYNMSPKQIILEITERDLLDKNNHIFITQMRKLIDLGYSLAIDDYGTGHASISYIQHFPFNYLKIDQIFVQAIGSNAINESLIDTIISMAKNLNLVIIAEGVETQEQVSYLINNNVQFLQGWYFSKAVNIHVLKELIEEKNNEGLY